MPTQYILRDSQQRKRQLLCCITNVILPRLCLLFVFSICFCSDFFKYQNISQQEGTTSIQEVYADQDI